MPDYEPDAEMKAALATVDPFSKYRDLAGKIYNENGRTDMYPTGWEQFDQYIGGGFGSKYRGELVVLVADTGVGKSTMMTNIALRIAPTSNQHMHYISLENPPEDAYNTMCHILGRSTLGEMENYFTAPSKEMLFGMRPWRSEDLMAHMEYMVTTHGYKLFALDHLNFMFENEEQVKNEWVRVRVVMRLLSQFCMNHKATVFVVSHINKNSSADLLTLDRIYGSSSIAGAATKVISLNEVKDSNPRQLDIEMLKSRYTTWDRRKLVRFDVSDYAWEEIGLHDKPKPK